MARRSTANPEPDGDAAGDATPASDIAFSIDDATGEGGNGAFDALFGERGGGDGDGDTGTAPRRRGRPRGAGKAQAPAEPSNEVKGLGLKATLTKAVRTFGTRVGNSLPQPYGRQIWAFDKDELDLICGPLATGIKGLTGAADELPPKMALLVGGGAFLLLTGVRVFQTQQLIRAIQAQQQRGGISYQASREQPVPEPQDDRAPEMGDFSDLERGDLDAA